MLSRLPRVPNENVLVGFETADDAGVYKLTPECALVQTTDFFTPIVDDPFQFGAIAAANSLSDIYAMGGKPLTALSLVCFPVKGAAEDLERILLGGAEKMREAGCFVLGGHSVNDDEIKFGYAVTGTVHPERVWTNTGARPGDALVFTKRIGTGVISTALKNGVAKESDVEASIQSMLQLNRGAVEALAGLEVHGCTDVSGFGLIGHLRELALGSRVTLEIDSGAIRFLPGALEYARRGAIPAGLKNNRIFAECAVTKRRTLPDEIESLLYDPQTSGGLLVSLPGKAAEIFVSTYPDAYHLGRVVQSAASAVVLG